MSRPKGLCSVCTGLWGFPDFAWLRLLLFLRRWVVALLGNYIQSGPVDAYVDRSELAIKERLVGGIDQRVLIARLLGDGGVALFDAVQIAFGIRRSAGLDYVAQQPVVVHRERQVEAAQIALAPAGGVAHQCPIDSDLVGLQVTYDVFVDG